MTATVHVVLPPEPNFPPGERGSGENGTFAWSMNTYVDV